MYPDDTTYLLSKINQELITEMFILAGVMGFVLQKCVSKIKEIRERMYGNSTKQKALH